MESQDLPTSSNSHDGRTIALADGVATPSKSPALNHKRTLVITLGLGGGVATMARDVCELLRSGGLEADVAHYMPHRMDSSLSVPLWKSAFAQPRSRMVEQEDGSYKIEVGVRLPEFEWSRYLPWKSWTELFARYDQCLVISGSILPGLSLALTGKPILAWVATDFSSDRVDRVRRFPLWRKAIDCILEAPLSRLSEKFILRRAKVMALSKFTHQRLSRLAPQASISILPGFVDTSNFVPKRGRKLDPNAVHIGTVSRFNDPRKNTPFLIEAFAKVARKLPGSTLHLIGGKMTEELLALAEREGVADSIRTLEYVEKDQLPELYQSFDVFALPSLQEGLCLSGLEALACGCPIVSTRCGGPEEYVRDGYNGYLTDFSTENFAQRLLETVASEEHYQGLSLGAVRTVEGGYSKTLATELFWKNFNEVFHQQG